MVYWIPKFNLLFVLLIGFQLLNGFGILGNKNIHSASGVIELILLLLVFSFIPFHIVALSKETIQVLDKNKRFERYKKIVSGVKKASFFYAILGFLFILLVILSGVGIITGVNNKFFHTISAVIFPVIVIYIFAKHYYLGTMLCRIEESVCLKGK